MYILKNVKKTYIFFIMLTLLFAHFFKIVVVIVVILIFCYLFIYTIIDLVIFSSMLF